MGDATAKVSLDSSGYEAGAQKVQAADRATAATAKESFDKMGAAATSAFAASAGGADRAGRSFRDMATEADRASRAVVAAAKKAAEQPWLGVADESSAYQAKLKQFDDRARAEVARRAIANVKIPQRNRVGAEDSYADIRYEGVVGASSRAARGGEGGGGGGFNRANLQELEHVARSFTEELSVGVSPTRAFIVEAPRLLQALGGALSGIILPAAAIAGPAALLVALESNRKSAVLLRDEIGQIGLNANNISGAGIGGLTESLKAANAEYEKVVSARNGFFNRVANVLDRDSGVTAADVGAANRQRNRVGRGLEAAQDRELDTRIKEFNGDPGVAAEKAKNDLAERRNEIFRQVASKELQNGDAAIARAEKEYGLQLTIIARREAFEQNEIGLETRLAYIRASGSNVQSRSASARRERAEADLDSGPLQGPERARRLANFKNAQTDEEEAKRAEKNSFEELELRTVNANRRGGSNANAYADAVAARDVLAQRNTQKLKPDEQKALDAQLAEANARIHNLVTDSYERASQVERLDTGTATGRGPAEQIKAIDRRLQGIETDRKTNEQRNGNDPLVAAQLNNEAHGLKTQKEDIQFAESQTLDAAKEHTSEMRLQIQGQTMLASLEGVRFSYQQQITSALRDGKNELAGQLQIQSNMAQRQARMAAYFNPGAARAERAAKEAQERREKQYDSTGGLTNVHRRIDGSIEDGIDPITGKRVSAKSFAEQNRPKELPKPAANTAIDPNVSALVTAIQGFAAKIGIA